MKKLLSLLLAVLMTMTICAKDIYADDPAYVAQIGEEKFESLQAALTAAGSSQDVNGKHIVLLTNLENQGQIFLPDYATLDGDGNIISGSSCVYLGAHGTIENVIFKNIHNTNNDLSAIYAINGNEIFTIKNCEFDNVDWDSIQFTPKGEFKAKGLIINNVFKHSEESTAAHRYIHVQSNMNVDFSITIKFNKFYNCDKLDQTGIEVYYPTDVESVNISENFMDVPMAVCVGMKDKYNDHPELTLPFVTEDSNEESLKIELVTGYMIVDGNDMLYCSFDDAINDGANFCIDTEYVYSNGMVFCQFFKTLEEAINAVKDEGTIYVLKDLENQPGISIDSKKTFTIDFCGNRYETFKPGAGSSNTQTNAFQLLKGQTITMRNGIIACSEANKDLEWAKTSTDKGIAIIIQNYCNLTLDNMTIDGTNIAHNGASVRYILSNNSGNVLYNNSTILTTGNDIAFDSCEFGDYDVPFVTIKNCDISGGFELSGGKIYVQSGKIKGEIKMLPSYVKDFTVEHGMFEEPIDEVNITGNNDCIANTDPNTKIDYPYTIGKKTEPVVDVTTGTSTQTGVIIEKQDITIDNNALENVVSEKERAKLVSDYPTADILIDVVLRATESNDREANEAIEEFVKEKPQELFDFIEITITKTITVDGVEKKNELVPTTADFQYITYELNDELKQAFLDANLTLDNILVIRKHNSSVNQIQKVANRADAIKYNGDCYFVENDSIVIQSKNFSVYAFGVQEATILPYKFTPKYYIPPQTGIE